MTTKKVIAGLLASAIFATSASATALMQPRSDHLVIPTHITAPDVQITNAQWADPIFNLAARECVDYSFEGIDSPLQYQFGWLAAWFSCMGKQIKKLRN